MDKAPKSLYPRTKSGILRIQYGHAAAATERFPFGRDNLKNILVRTFKFGMWVYMGNATNAIVLWPWPSISRSLVAS